jgi:hypothetical protein
MGYSSSPGIGGSFALFTAPSEQYSAAASPNEIRAEFRCVPGDMRDLSPNQTVRWAYALGDHHGHPI